MESAITVPTRLEPPPAPAAAVEPAPPGLPEDQPGPTGPGFSYFYQDTRERIARALAVTIGDRDLAIEATDEAMTRAYQRWKHVGDLDNPAGWVYRVALNWATSVLRRRQRPWPSGRQHDVVDAPAVTEPAVAAALAELDVRQRAVVVCRYLLDWSEAETAAALSTPVGTVKSRLHRANQHLATRLDHLRP